MIIPAAGSGSRLRGRVPKQFLRLGGVPVLARTVAAFDAIPAVRRIVVAAPARHQVRARRMLARLDLRASWQVVTGGAERQESVWCALAALDPLPAVVLVHDAVRPLVSGRIIREVIRTAARSGAAIAVVPVKDTIREVRGRGSRTLDRSALRAVQTPQGFRTALLLRAHRAARRRGFLGTDEASLVERLGVKVHLVEGEYRNIKITTPEDLATASRYLE